MTLTMMPISLDHAIALIRVVVGVLLMGHGTAYTLEDPAPGLTAEELIVTATGDMLAVEVQPRASTDRQSRMYLVQEVPRERLARVFTFPTTIDVDSVDAHLEQGMLRIRIPKAEGARSRVIKIQE
jgi:HSP20 family protein